MDRPTPPPPQLFARDSAENEWWYYHGHLSAGSREFAFHLAFFRQRTDRIRIGSWIPLGRFREQFRFAHFALTDISERRFHYGQRNSLFGDAGAASDGYHVWLRDWSAKAAGASHRLQAGLRNVRFDLELQPLKPLVSHGEQGAFQKRRGVESVYCSYSRMTGRGRVVVGGESYDVSGLAWMDREIGQFTFCNQLSGWDWFAAHLEDGRELMIYRLRDSAGRQTEFSTGALISHGGETTPVDGAGIEIEPLEHWKSSATGNVYPVSWRIRLAAPEADLRVTPFLRRHEMDTRGSTCFIYWEGPTTVSGVLTGRSAAGRGFAELVGYQAARPQLGVYDFSRNRLTLAGWLANHIRLRRWGPGVTLVEPR